MWDSPCVECLRGHLNINRERRVSVVVTYPPPTPLYLGVLA